MSSRRVRKVAEAIREVIGMAILTELKDPRIADVTVTYVDVSADLRWAKVHVSVMGSDAKQKLCLHGLESSIGFLQRKISERIDTRYTPKLEFKLDMGVKRSIEIAQILKEVLPHDRDIPDNPESLSGRDLDRTGEHGVTAGTEEPDTRWDN
jgi:ribosome-binding factor A